LVDVFGFQLVFGSAVDRRGDLSDRVPKPAVTQVELSLLTSPRQVQPAWFFSEHAEQRWRDSGRSFGVEVTCMPVTLALGDDQKDPLDRLGRFPMLNLPGHPR
jgi:hypothetical protein